MKEFDIKGIILDLGVAQQKHTGASAVRQMMRITGRTVPCVIGLGQRLRSRDDKALDQPDEFQGAVKMILSVLRASPEPVVIVTVGSGRDIVAAFNREPELLKRKVRAVYCSIGRAPPEQNVRECNSDYDSLSYQRLFETGLPLYWCPCAGNDGYSTYYFADELSILKACDSQVQNYFAYCLTRDPGDPIAFLDSGPHPLSEFHRRNMWSTPALIHAAGRRIYEQAANDYVALAPDEAAKAGLGSKAVDCFQFVPMHAGFQDRPAMQTAPEGRLVAEYWSMGSDARSRDNDFEQHNGCVRTLGAPADKQIKDIVITGPKGARWEYIEPVRRQRVTYEREGKYLDLYFQLGYTVKGEHSIDLTFADGSTQSAKVDIPNDNGGGIKVEINAARPNGYVFRQTDKRYNEIMASCLKQLLAGLGRNGIAADKVTEK
ncbi:MAG: hypothetical protein PHC88_04710 [Terrimicrobiaceae bacterium]|nr:hypothetical protein [Terrimicrobiaceae bacterium]